MARNNPLSFLRTTLGFVLVPCVALAWVACRSSSEKAPSASTQELARLDNESRTVPPGFVRVAEGPFLMGDSHGEGEPWERPVRKVWVDTFYLAQNEITVSEWNQVLDWALAQGYQFDGGRPGTGKAPNHPITDVSWYDAVKWANARSEMEGRIPAYYTDSDFTGVYRVGDMDLSPAQVDWTADGYRLPTEAEWEKAARGGRTGEHYPWPSAGASYRDHVAPSRANFVLSGDPFEKEPFPQTTPVGFYGSASTSTTFGYQAFNDLAGNVWEWCWDVWALDTYRQMPESSRNPQGPIQGEYRVQRGGSWGTDARLGRVAFRGSSSPAHRCNCAGFRLAFSASQKSPQNKGARSTNATARRPRAEFSQGEVEP